MGAFVDTWFVLVIVVAGWMNREQNRALAYVQAENQALKEQLKGKGKVRFTDKQRCLLATAAKTLGRRTTSAVFLVSTPPGVDDASARRLRVWISWKKRS
ncbi:hypothetical protein ACFL6C_03885 [Myxococcota bacterium]